MRGIFLSVLFNTLVKALPQIAFPFNSQVPTVARVESSYEFSFAATTFSSGDGSSLSYSLTDAPTWLNLNNATRTLYGTPGQANTGPNIFTITATGNDGSVDMGCTLVVASNSAPTVSGNVSENLARSGSLAGPTTLILPPSKAFAITFSDDLFQDSPGRIQAYYATMSDHTPLPSWIMFESDNLAFSGITPVLTTGSQTYVINLIASDVVGFAGAVVTFTLIVATNQLAFNPQTEDVTVMVGQFITLGSYRNQLQLNGKEVSFSQLRRASAKVPVWLDFQNETLELTGTAPHDFQAQTVTISVTDVYGDTAVKSIYLRSSNTSILIGEIGNLTATAGKPFSYTIDQSTFFGQADVNASMELGSASSWLDFDSSKLELQGTPPSTVQATVISATLTASSSAATESQAFVINLKAAAASARSSGSSTSSELRTSATSTPTSSFSANPSATPSKKSDKAGIIVGIVIGCLAIMALFFAVVMLCCRRRRRHPSKKDKPAISRPIPAYSDQEPIMAEEHYDVERAVGSPVKHSPDEPPQLDIDLPVSSRALAVKPKHILGDKAARQSKLSVVSSLGDAEATIRADSNIPVWGRKSVTTHTPHDSYSAATELARASSRASRQHLSEFSKLSPSKRVARMIRHSWHNSIGLGINVRSSVIHRPDRRGRMSSVFSIGRDRSSLTSLNTHGMSIFSTRPSDFPEPPSHRHSRSVPAVYLTEAEKRRSIRLVSRTESVADARPFYEKRQSFIRNRASGDIISPLFASSRRSSNMGLYSQFGSLNGRSPSVRQTTLMSLDPPARNPRRLASGASTFAPNFPRAISPSPARNNSPTLPALTVTADDSEAYTTTTGTSSSLSRDNSDARAAAEFIAQSALPRYERDWVLPGEASPTPPPSSVLRADGNSREAARRRWAKRMNRSSHGSLLSRSPSPLRSTLSGVSSQGVRSRKERLRSGLDEDKENRIEPPVDRLSKLVSNDSLSGARHMRGRRSMVQVDTAPRISSSRARVEDGATLPGANNEGENDEAEWEDVVSESAGNGGVPPGVLATSTSNSSGVRFL